MLEKGGVTMSRRFHRAAIYHPLKMKGGCEALWVVIHRNFIAG